MRRCYSSLVLLIFLLVVLSLNSFFAAKSYKKSEAEHWKIMRELNEKNVVLENRLKKLELKYDSVVLKYDSLRLVSKQKKNSLLRKRSEYDSLKKIETKNDFQRDSILKVLYPDLIK